MTIATYAQHGVETAEGVPTTRTRGELFGIEVDIGLPVWPVRAPSAASQGRRTIVEGSTGRALEGLWRSADPVRVFERLFPNGQRSLTVDYCPAVGYRVWACRMGCHVVAADGSQVLSVPSRLPLWVWQRLLFGQVLPLAATLQGLELVHASSVVVRDKTLAFSAVSGTGKTSLAAHLVATGAALLTDDVLAVEVTPDGRVLAHPGGPLVAVAAAELERLAPNEVLRIGVPGGRGDKVMLKANLVSGPSFLDAIYFLERTDTPGELSIESLPHDPLRPLAQSFISYVRTRARVRNQLKVCAALTERVQMFSVAVPGGCPASAVAAAITRHSEEHP